MPKHTIMVKKVHTMLGTKYQAIPLDNGRLAAFGDTEKEALERAKDNLREFKGEKASYHEVEI